MKSNKFLINTWLKSIGKKRGLSLSLDVDGGTCLDCTDGTQVLIEVLKESDLFFFYTPLIRLPEDVYAQCAVMKKTLALGNFSLKTGGASFGFDTRTSSLLLTFAERIKNMDSNTFAECLGRFIETAMDMKSHITSEALTSHGHQEKHEIIDSMIRC